MDAAGCNIKCPAGGSFQATGSVCHDEIVFGIGVPRPKGITAFHQVVNDQRLPRSEAVAAIAAGSLWSALLQINRDHNGCLGWIVDTDLDLFPCQISWQNVIDTWICRTGIDVRSRSE